MGSNTLTDREYWQNYWKFADTESAEVKRTTSGLSVNAILDIFDKYLPVDDRLDALEIGGAPGKYLIYMARNFKYQVHSLDYSRIGNEQTLKNLKIANVPVRIYERDLLSNNFRKDLPSFDIVYSLGLVEHFEDLKSVVKKHLELLKPGGILLLGVPNLGGIYKIFLQRTAPKHLALHNLQTMNIKNWIKFETDLGLTVIFKGYVGGFEPLIMDKLERHTWLSHSLNVTVRNLSRIFSYKLRWLRSFNSRYWSEYLIGIYRK
jgi:SAM-dependent methyltransferase